MGNSKNPPGLSTKADIQYWTSDATLPTQVSKPWLAEVIPLNQHNNTLHHIKWKCTHETETDAFKQQKTVGVLLHSSSEILQYPALGQARGNIL